MNLHPILNFKNQQLLHQALTHRSYANESNGEPHNERLEFLGDAILNFVSGDYLYRHCPELQEDEMTRRRSALVDEKQLAKFAVNIGLDFRMRLGRGLIQSGGYQNPNLLSCTFEAVVGAYYLDSDRQIEKVRPLIEELFDSVQSKVIERRSQIDAKNRFQEWVQTNFAGELPKYNTERIGGADHAPTYLSKVMVAKKVYGQGEATGKKEAEKRAATDALSKLDKN